MNSTSSNSRSEANSVNSSRIDSNLSSLQSARSILFTHTTRWGIRSSEAMKAWRLDCSITPGARIDQHQRQVGGGGAGDHVARVLLVARRVGDDELAPGGLEVAVGDVDRDALLALGAQAVGEQGEVHVAVAVALGHLARRARAGRRGSAWSRTAAGRSGSTCRRRPSRRWRTGAARRTGIRRPLRIPRAGFQPALLRRMMPSRHQKYPSRLRSSIAASVTRSSARVSPRSVIRVAAISATTTSTIVDASERTPPVQLMSPTVR